MPFIRFSAGLLLALLVAACAVGSAYPGEAVRRALAPSGQLRVGLISVPVHSVKDPYSGEPRGVSHDSGRELAARLGVPLEPIVCPNPAAYVAAGQAGQWDIGSLGLAPEHQAHFDLAQPRLEVDCGCLVPADTRIASISGPPGLRQIKGFHDEALSGQWKGHRSSRLGDQWRVIYRGGS